MILYRPSKVDGPWTSVKSARFPKPTHRNTNGRNPFGRPSVITYIPHRHKGHPFVPLLPTSFYLIH